MTSAYSGFLFGTLADILLMIKYVNLKRTIPQNSEAAQGKSEETGS